MHLLSIVWAVCLALAALVQSGCADETPEPKQQPAKLQPAKKVQVGRNVALEIKGDKRRVLVDAYVCLRKGQLEQLLTRKDTKEHEAILAADVDARDIHTALVLAGAEPGKPVQFRPKYQPAHGTVVKVLMEYEERGNKTQVPAAQWILNSKTRKALDIDWVFGGSQLLYDPDDTKKTKKPFYAANSGDVICVSNFDTAMLDLPIDSTRDNDYLTFVANTERIPPLDTRVLVILEPVQVKKKQP